MERAFKAFNKDLTCDKGRGIFQYKPGIWFEEEQANCVKNGFHAAKNPLDCLSYYPAGSCVIWLVDIDGDIDEDARDSKVSATRIRLVRQLTMPEFVLEACNYIMDHANEKEDPRVQQEQGTARDGFAIVRGKAPKARGARGDVIAVLQEEEDSREIEAAGIYLVGKNGCEPGKWYGPGGAA